MVSKSSAANAAGLSIIYVALIAGVAGCLWSPSYGPGFGTGAAAFSYVRHL